jgi:hypothetical protein
MFFLKLFLLNPRNSTLVSSYNFMIKNFLFPKLKYSSSQYFYRFFGSFYRRGGAAISEFREGLSSPRLGGVKTVRTISRIDHQNMLTSFWNWYERSHNSQLRIAAVVFALQIIHLLWLTTDVVLPRLFGTPILLHGYLAQAMVVFVDYLEMPTLITVSLIYLKSFSKQRHWRDLAYLVLLNSQWLHILWITDEFIVDIFSSPTSSTALLVAWTALLIDYLELPVIYETMKRAFR